MMLTADEIIDKHLNLVGPTKFDVYSNREAVKEAMIMFATQEISDEEIYKAAGKATYDPHLGWENDHALEAFIKGVFWYKRQLKLRSNDTSKTKSI